MSKAKSIPTSRTRLKTAFNGIKNTENDKLLSFAYSPNCYGFAFRGGILKSDLGLRYGDSCYSVENDLRHAYQPMPSGVNIVNAYVYNRTNEDGSYDDRIIAQTDENLLYQTKMFTNDGWAVVNDVSFSGKGCAVNYNYNSNDCLLLCSPNNDLVIINDASISTVPSAPRFSSMCVHYERIFATDSTRKNSVWFSDDFNPTNWDVSLENGGFITFADECGDVLKVVSFLDYVYVFREHGIFRLIAYADQTEFSLSKVYVDTGKIFGNTIAQYGDKIIFMADDGLYIFDGYDVARIVTDLPELEQKSKAVGTCSLGKYYLACRISDYVTETNTSCINNALVEYDTSTKMFSILLGADIVHLISVNVHHNVGVLAVFGSGATRFMGSVDTKGKILTNPTSKHWESPVNDLTSERKKVVREMQLTTSANIVIGVIVDGQSFEYEVEGSTLPQKVIVGKAGYSIGFYINSTAEDIELTPPIVILDLIL
ncbi:MAG: hypothetical protein PHE93_00800 [Clostridia bacterium]|nr:hypothetical protein [Clostridia bacterium]